MTVHIDQRLLDVQLVLATPGGKRLLTAEEASIVFRHVATIRHEAAKWRLKLGQPGRLILVDPDVVSAALVALEDRSGSLERQ